MIAEDFFFMFITRTRVKERHSYHIWSDRVNMQHQLGIRRSQKPDFFWIAVQAKLAGLKRSDIASTVRKVRGTNESRA
jgi:hypothetical protein